MDRDFDRVDKDVRELRAETKSEFALLRGEMCERFDRVESQFATVAGQFVRVEEQFERRFDRADRRFEAIDARLDNINKTMVQAAIGMTAAFVTGFAALAGLIATSL
jgi:hypothetical protein